MTEATTIARRETPAEFFRKTFEPAGGTCKRLSECLGPAGSDVEMIEVWSVALPDVGGALFVVQRFKGDDGWTIFGECPHADFYETAVWMRGVIDRKPEPMDFIARGPFCWGRGKTVHEALRQAKRNLSPSQVNPEWAAVYHVHKVDPRTEVTGMGGLQWPAHRPPVDVGWFGKTFLPVDPPPGSKDDRQA